MPENIFTSHTFLNKYLFNSAWDHSKPGVIRKAIALRGIFTFNLTKQYRLSEKIDISTKLNGLNKYTFHWKN